jgi:hypothetical protein
MSSRRRRSRDKATQADAFNQESNDSNADAGNLEDFANMLYSSGIGEELRKADSTPARVKKIPLEKIIPDPVQARRVMPHFIRRKWIQNPGAVVEVLNEWLTRADTEAERLGRPPIDVPALLARDPDNPNIYIDDDEAKEMGPVEASFRAMVGLAASIRHHGLANPITVVPHGNTFQLETGERRLLAYNLLHSLPQEVSEATFETIPARVVESKSLWRQAAENGARQNLNAISLARQLALLLMDVYKDKHTFALANDMPDRDWYAQVYDSKQFPVPYGRAAELAAAVGLKSGNQIRQYRALLDLPETVWLLADNFNWTEYKIRQMRTDAKKIARRIHTEREENALITLARYEGGQSAGLPAEYEAVLGKRFPKKGTEQPPAANETSAPGDEERTDGRTIARGLPCTVQVVDVPETLLTLQVDDPEVLNLLQSGERITISIKRSKGQDW